MNARASSIALALACGLAAGQVGAGFSDPLTTPALPSSLASQGLFNGLARAGARIVAAGQRGHILYSDDAGVTWTQAAVPLSCDLTAVQFPTERDGWAVGHDGVVLVSHDAGASWAKQLDGRAVGALLAKYYAEHAPEGASAERVAQLRADAQRFADEGPDKPFLDVWFQSAQSGYVVGAFNLLLHTEDGGNTWQPWLDRDDNPRALHLYAIRPVGSDVYVVGEQGLVLKLDRAAQRFRLLALPYKGTLFGVAGDAESVIVFGLRGNAYRSTDGGAAWTQVPTGVAVSLTGAASGAGGQLFLVSQTGQVLRSSDGGATLGVLPLQQRVPGSAALSLDAQTLLVAGARGLQRVSLPASPETRR